MDAEVGGVELVVEAREALDVRRHAGFGLQGHEHGRDGADRDVGERLDQVGLFGPEGYPYR
ncbi:MAG: hypothetical protein ACRDY0_12370 [Acidimicrobiales bacterium]